MGDEPFKTRPETSTKTSSTGSRRSTSPHHLAYATERAKILFGSYRRGDANDPDIYVASIARVLSSFEPELIREVTDPLTGIMTTEKYMTFMPNAGELKVYCDGVAARKERIQRLGSLPPVDFSRTRLPAPPPAPGDKATIFVPAANPRYPQLVEWSKTADPRQWKFGTSSDNLKGIWVSYDTWDRGHIAKRKRVDDAKPTSLVLSDAARRVMADLDAERSGNFGSDSEAAE